MIFVTLFLVVKSSSILNQRRSLISGRIGRNSSYYHQQGGNEIFQHHVTIHHPQHPAKCATIYEHGNYEGEYLALPVSNAFSVISRSLNGEASSARVEENCKLTLYDDHEYPYPSRTYTADTTYFSDFNDRATRYSCRCNYRPIPTTLRPWGPTYQSTETIQYTQCKSEYFGGVSSIANAQPSNADGPTAMAMDQSSYDSRSRTSSYDSRSRYCCACKIITEQRTKIISRDQTDIIYTQQSTCIPSNSSDTYDGRPISRNKKHLSNYDICETGNDSAPQAKCAVTPCAHGCPKKGFCNGICFSYDRPHDQGCRLAAFSNQICPRGCSFGQCPFGFQIMFDYNRRLYCGRDAR